MPASTASVAPVIADACGEHKKATAFAMSRPSIVRPSGVAFVTFSLPPWRRRRSAPAPFMGDVINPGAIQLTRMPLGPHATPNVRVSDSTPALLA